MTEVLPNSSINEKSKQSIFNRIKLIQRYFSQSTLHSKSMDKSSKSILTNQHKTLNDNLLPCQQITSSKSNDHHHHHHHDKKNWTMKQFKNYIKINHSNKHQHKSTTLTVIPTRQMITPYSSYSYNPYHTLKEISFNKNEMINVQTFKSIDDISSLQQSISLSSLSLDDDDDDDDDDDQNKSYQKITNLDEMNDENMIVTKFVNDIIKQSDLDKSWLTIDDDNDHHHHQQQREQHQQQRERQQQQQREQQQQQQREQRQHQREQQQREQQQRQLSMSDIYPICTSHDQLNDSLKYFTSLSSNMSIIKKKEKNFNILSSILSKCNNNNDKSLLLKRNLNRLKKCKTLSTMEIDLLLCENTRFFSTGWRC
ncbi:unnamed protein product [Schistosoma bovis]|nr:unnamed protein product [Schistosoma bovis]